MKVEWEASDIRAGRIVGKPGRAERHMIGYRGDMRAEHFTLNSLTDGLTSIPCSAEAMARGLNKAGEIPAELLS